MNILRKSLFVGAAAAFLFGGTAFGVLNPGFSFQRL